jgi:hypothetical protein
MVVPWFFTCVDIVIGDPIEIPPDLNGGAVQAHCARIRVSLEALERELESGTLARPSSGRERALGSRARPR